MIKSIVIEFSEDSEWELKAYADAIKNHIAIEALYDEVFRPFIKYQTPINGNKELTDEQYETIEKIWEKVKNHFRED